MKAHVFRDFSYLPSPVTAVSSNQSTIAVFRRNGTMELVDSTTLCSFIRYDIELVIVRSYFIDIRSILALSECNKVLLIDITTLRQDSVQMAASSVAVQFSPVQFAPRRFFLSTLKNELFEIGDGKATLIGRESGHVSNLLAAGKYLLVGRKDGPIRIYQNGVCTGEVDAKAQVNGMVKVGDERFVAVLENGRACLFDADAVVILDTVEARTTALRAVAYLDGTVHMSGEDSRIVAYDLSKGRFNRICQADYHCSAVLCMEQDNGHIITAGEDSALIFNTLHNSRYTQQRVYEAAVKSGRTNNYFYVGTDRSINLFGLHVTSSGVTDTTASAEAPTDEPVPAKAVVSEASQASAKIQDSSPEQMSFRIAPDILKQTNQRETKFNFFLNFNIEGKLLCASVSPDEKFLAYSNSRETKFYDLFRGSKLNIEKIRSFGPALQIVFTEKYLVMVEMTMKIVVFDLNTFKILTEIPYDDFRERVVVTGRRVYLINSKKVIDLSKMDHAEETPVVFEPLKWDCVSQAVATADDRVALLVKDEGTQRILIDGEEPVVLEGIQSNVHLASDRLLYDDRYLFVVGGSEIKKYEIGSLISGAIDNGEEVIVLQTAWSYLKSKMKPSVFKKKFSN